MRDDLARLSVMDVDSAPPSDTRKYGIANFSTQRSIGSSSISKTRRSELFEEYKCLGSCQIRWKRIDYSWYIDTLGLDVDSTLLRLLDLYYLLPCHLIPPIRSTASDAGHQE